MSTYYNRFNSEATPYLDTLRQPIPGSILLLFFITLAGKAAPKVLPQLDWLHSNYFFRVLVCFLLLWVNNQDPATSLLVSVGFITSLTWLGKWGSQEGFEGPQTAILPSCLKITTFDLLEAFDGDKDKLVNAMVSSRVPLNIKLNDEYASLIATYLVNYGYPMKKSTGCDFPSGDAGAY